MPSHGPIGSLRGRLLTPPLTAAVGESPHGEGGPETVDPTAMPACRRPVRQPARHCPARAIYLGHRPGALVQGLAQSLESVPLYNYLM